MSKSEASIAKVGDTLFFEAKEESLTYRTGIYRITNQNNVLMALFKGIAYHTSKEVS